MYINDEFDWLSPEITVGNAFTYTLRTAANATIHLPDADLSKIKPLTGASVVDDLDVMNKIRSLYLSGNVHARSAFVNGCSHFRTHYLSLYADDCTDKACRVWINHSAKYVDLNMCGGIWYDSDGMKLPHSKDFSLAPEGIILYDNNMGIYYASFGSLLQTHDYVYYPSAPTPKL